MPFLIHSKNTLVLQHQTSLADERIFKIVRKSKSIFIENFYFLFQFSMQEVFTNKNWLTDESENDEEN